MSYLRIAPLICAGLVMLSLSQGAQSQATDIGAVWANEGGDKVAQGELRAAHGLPGVLNRVWDGHQVSIFAARNEVVDYNLVLEAPTGATNIALTFSALSGPGGAVISSVPASGDQVFDWTQRQIEPFYVRYLPIKGLSLLSYTSYYDERHAPQRMRRPWTGDGVANPGTGWVDRPDHDALYPDIAVPLELVPSFAIAAGQNQSIWVDIYVPKTAPAGLYAGTVTVTESGIATHQVPVQLTVRNFQLPDVPSSKTMVYMSYENLNKRFFGVDYMNPNDPSFPAARLIRQRYFQLAHRHRISLIDANYYDYWQADAPAPEWIPRLDGTLFTPAFGYDGPGVNTGNQAFAVGVYGGWSWRNGTQADMWQHTDAWVNWFDQNAPGVDYFLYLTDEPPAAKYSQVETWAEWIHNDPGPGHRMKSFVTIPLPNAVASTPSVDIPASFLEEGITNVWEADASAYTSDPVRRFYMYNGARPASGSFATEDDGVALRELAWGQYKKHINRWFFWESTYYNNFQGGTGQTSLFQDGQTFGGKPSFDPVLGNTGWNYGNGDGVLLYPGTDTLFPADSYGVNGPFASLRLKQWRRGIQDVDYLTLAAAIDPVRVQQIVDAMVPKALWEYGVDNVNDPTYVHTDISWSTNPDDWEDARAQLANIIDAALLAPSNLTAVTAPPYAVDLTWKDNNAGTSGFEIQRKNGSGSYVPLASVSAGTTTYLDAGLAPLTTYTYRVLAVRSGVTSDFSNEAAAITAPAPPPNLTAMPGNRQITLKWGASAGASSYSLFRAAASGGPYTVIASKISRKPVTDRGLLNGVTYYYVATARGLGGDSAPCSEVSAAPKGPPPPLPPTHLVAAAGTARVRLTWSASAGASSYSVYRGTISDGPYRAIVQNTRLRVVNDKAVTRGTTYYYVVTAKGPGGESGYSNEAPATPGP